MSANWRTPLNALRDLAGGTHPGGEPAPGSAGAATAVVGHGLPGRSHSAAPGTAAQASSHLEQQYIKKALKRARGSVSRCAKICGLSRRSMTTKIADYKIDKSEYKNI